jgi:N-acyl homoserine lactone hydrolase
MALGLALAAALSACRVTSHPTEPFAPPAARSTPADWDAVLAAPVDVEVQAVVSARWAASRKGLVDLKHPTAKEAGLKNDRVPIVLHVGVVRHPTAGDFIVDTGVSESLAQGERRGAVRGLARALTKSMEPLESLSGIVARHRLQVSGVLLTHSHFDHVLGLPDLAPEVPIYVGPGEFRQRHMLNGLLRPTLRRLLAGRVPVREIDPATTIALDPFPAVIDLVGDGSIWGIVCEGHTKGSMAWLVNATDGPALFVGDTSHTRWGWDHDVPPGTFTSDQELNAEALARLRLFVQQHPETKVYVGHEL